MRKSHEEMFHLNNILINGEVY